MGDYAYILRSPSMAPLEAFGTRSTSEPRETARSMISPD